MPQWLVGQIVDHKGFGRGTVRAILAEGEKLRIYFRSIDASKVIPAASLQEAGEPRSAPAPVPSKVPSPLSDAQRKARLTLECLRQGLPPAGGLQKWTVGLTDTRTQIGAALHDAVKSGRGTVVVVEGTYGQGKSHIGRWAREVALSREVATMHTEIDGGGISLTNSTRLLARLFASLALPEGDGTGHPVLGLGTLLKKAAPATRRSIPKGCDAFAPFLEHSDRWQSNEEAVEVLEEYLASELARSKAEYRLSRLGIPISLPALRTNWGRLEDRLVAQARQLARVVALTRACGAKAGLVVLDELDHDFSGISGQQEARAMATLKAWSRTLAAEPVVVLLLAPPGLPRWAGSRRLALPLLSGKELKEVTSSVVEAYRVVRPDVMVGDGVDRLFTRLLADFNSRFKDEGWGPRYFVRATVEACERAVQKQVPLKAVPLG